MSLTKKSAINNIILLKDDWNWMEFQIKMFKSKIESLNTLLSLKDKQIKGLKTVIDSYKDYSKQIKPHWWQSPFMDVVYFIGGFIGAVFLIHGIGG